ncbi:hypothetical protein QBC39DRAFT_264448 [Podospora conica]|nr:hypothetical protein QBC39DRAFT_264448 [Schizothecium conicum]
MNSKHESTLEVVPSTGLEAMPPTFHATTIVNNSWSRPPSQNEEKQGKKILGLSVKAFWATIVVLVVLLAAGIGGGLGALAAKKGTATTTTTTSNTSPTPTEPQAAGMSPAPSDGCPAIDGTTYVPKRADGVPVLIDITAPEMTFTRHCATDFSSGPSGGNPDIHDILKLYVPTLEECITVCAMYNARYQYKIDKKIEVAGGLCKSVTIVKKPGGYCYLKNGTAKNVIKEGENPNDTSSASILKY